MGLDWRVAHYAGSMWYIQQFTDGQGDTGIEDAVRRKEVVKLWFVGMFVNKNPNKHWWMGGQVPLRKHLWALRQRRPRNKAARRAADKGRKDPTTWALNLLVWFFFYIGVKIQELKDGWSEGSGAGFPKRFLSGTCPPVSGYYSGCFMWQTARQIRVWKRFIYYILHNFWSGCIINAGLA